MDIDGDPFADLAYVELGHAQIALGDDRKGFGESRLLGIVAFDRVREYELVAAPLNGDEFHDVAAVTGVSVGESTIRWWAQQAFGGEFAPHQDTLVPGLVQSMIAVDLDGVPPSELVVSSLRSQKNDLPLMTTSLFRVTNDSLTEVSRFEGAAGPLVAIGTDKLVATRPGVVLRFTGGALEPVQQLDGVAEQASDALAVELNGDGNLDLVVIGTHASSESYKPVASAHISNSGGSLQFIANFSAEAGLAAADVDADGDQDLLFPLGHALVGILPGRGDGTFDAVREFFPRATGVRKILVAAARMPAIKPEVFVQLNNDQVRRLGQDCSL